MFDVIIIAQFDQDPYSLHLVPISLVNTVLTHPSPTPHLPATFPKLKSLGGFHPAMVGRVCVVIGAGPGLGISCAKRWAREGFKVFIAPFFPHDFSKENFIPRLL